MDNRYARQQLFKPIGKHGQQRLEQAAVTLIGCGALGSAIAETLVRAGVGQLHLIDRDIVELSNLQRQNLFTEQHATEMVPKVVAAKQRLNEIRSDCKLSITIDHADGMMLEQVAQKSDLLIDATDNFETRLMINDAAYKYDRAWIYGACVGGSGVVYPFVKGASACFRCMLPVLPAVNETCDTVGIISPAVQVTAAMQSVEALKLLTNQYDAVMKKVHYFDLWSNERIDIGITKAKRTDCPTCGPSPSFPSLSQSEQMKVVSLCGRETVQIIADQKRHIRLEDAEKAGKRAASYIRTTPYFVELKIDDCRVIIFENGRMLVHGTNDTYKARRLYHQLFG